MVQANDAKIWLLQSYLKQNVKCYFLVSFSALTTWNKFNAAFIEVVFYDTQKVRLIYRCNKEPWQVDETNPFIPAWVLCVSVPKHTEICESELVPVLLY